MTRAICALELIAQGDFQSAQQVACGSTLACDAHKAATFDFILANPPYGKDWKADEHAVRKEYEQEPAGRFRFGLPRITDGQWLFVQHILSHMKPAGEGGSRAAVVINGSPLFTGDAGSSESQIRRWMIECNYIEAIICLSESLFYNTAITTYIMVLNTTERSIVNDHVLIIDARDRWTKLARAKGEKRRSIGSDQRAEIIHELHAWQNTTTSKVCHSSTFGCRVYTVDRPQRGAVVCTTETLAQLPTLKAIQRLPTTIQSFGPCARDLIIQFFADLELNRLYAISHIQAQLIATAQQQGVKVPDKLVAALISHFTRASDDGEILNDQNGDSLPNVEQRDTERIPFDTESSAYLAEHVLPYVPDAFLNTTLRDPYDGAVGIVHYEVNINRLFYVYTPLRPLHEIDAELRELEAASRQLFSRIICAE